MARVRSPGYPALSLPEAVDMIRKVHAAQQSVPEPREVVIRHMGYSGVNGRSLKAISALIKYGFLEKVDRGDLRVSERALSILFADPDSPNSKHIALYEASREPQLFKEMFDRWESKPSPESVKAFLIKKEFNVNAPARVIVIQLPDHKCGFSISHPKRTKGGHQTGDEASDEASPRSSQVARTMTPASVIDHSEVSLYSNVVLRH